MLPRRVWLAMAASTDLLITASLVYLLNTVRRKVADFTQRWVRRPVSLTIADSLFRCSAMKYPLMLLMRHALESGLLTTLYAITCFITFRNNEQSNGMVRRKSPLKHTLTPTPSNRSLARSRLLRRPHVLPHDAVYPQPPEINIH